MLPAVLERTVQCDDPPGTVVENTFLILRLEDRRIFARLTIEVDAEGLPHQRCEAVTVQAIGG